MIISMKELVEKYNMNIRGVLHVGAHHGEEIDDYLNNGIKDICLFEPLSESVRVLEDKILNYENSANISLFPYALGNEEKEIEMFVSNFSGMCSSILKPKIHLTQYPDITFNEKQNVQMRRLDNINIDFKKYNFLNMDVQGYELEVLKGSTDILKNIDYLYTEINREEVYENAPHVDQLDSFLLNYNFFRVETDWSGQTWGDALYIKEEKK